MQCLSLQLQVVKEQHGLLGSKEEGITVLQNLYCCTVHLNINVYVHQLMHLFISPRKH